MTSLINKRWLAILIAPLATPLALAVVFVALSLWQLLTIPDWTPLLAFYGWILVAMFATPAAYLMMLVAVPLVSRLERRGRSDLTSVVQVGLFLGVSPFALYDIYIALFELARDPVGALPGLWRDVPTAVKWLALGASCGGATAWAYGSIRRSLIPDP